MYVLIVSSVLPTSLNSRGLSTLRDYFSRTTTFTVSSKFLSLKLYRVLLHYQLKATRFLIQFFSVPSLYIASPTLQRSMEKWSLIKTNRRLVSSSSTLIRFYRHLLSSHQNNKRKVMEMKAKKIVLNRQRTTDFRPRRTQKLLRHL